MMFGPDDAVARIARVSRRFGRWVGRGRPTMAERMAAPIGVTIAEDASAWRIIRAVTQVMH